MVEGVDISQLNKPNSFLINMPPKTDFLDGYVY